MLNCILFVLKNKSWLGSLINTVIGNLKLSISNIHIRYEDIERWVHVLLLSFIIIFAEPNKYPFCSNPGHPFASGVTLDKLLAMTVDDNGKEIFATGGALERIQKVLVL